MQRFSEAYPKRGEFYIADLDPGFGREMRKKRPVLVISHDSINLTRPHAVIIPASTIIPQTISEDMVSLGKPKGFNEESILLPVFIRSIDKDRFVKKIGKISKKKLLEIEKALKLVLGLDLIE